MVHWKCTGALQIPYSICLKTRAERIARTVEFFPRYTKMPTISFTDKAAEAARMIAEALLNPAPVSPFLLLGNEQIRAIRQLANLFSATILDTKPSTPPAAPALRPQPPPICAPPPMVQIRQPGAPALRVPVVDPPYPRRLTIDMNSEHSARSLPCRAEFNTPVNERSPTLIKPDSDDPVAYRYLLINQYLPKRTQPRTV